MFYLINLWYINVGHVLYVCNSLIYDIKCLPYFRGLYLINLWNVNICHIFEIIPNLFPLLLPSHVCPQGSCLVWETIVTNITRPFCHCGYPGSYVLLVPHQMSVGAHYGTKSLKSRSEQAPGSVFHPCDKSEKKLLLFSGNFLAQYKSRSLNISSVWFI